MASRLIIVAMILLGLSVSLLAAQPPGTVSLGLRLGLFANNTNQLPSQNDEVKLYSNRTNFYVEGFANYYFTSWLAGVLNLGSYSKGDIKFEVYINNVFDGQFIGQAAVYPMQLGLKVSPFEDQLPGKAKPYVEGGGAFIIGRETATIGPYDSYFARYTDGSLSTETDWGWWAGGGAEVPLSETLQFDSMIKYLRNDFSGDIAGIHDYSGWQFSVGIVYVFLPK